MGNQSGVVFGFIAVAFFVFITLKGELPIYAGLLLLSPATPGTGNTPAASNGTASAITSTIIQGAIDGLAG